jgi:hypothetical protein
MLPVSGLSIFDCPFLYSLTFIEQHESLITGGMKPGDFSAIIQQYRIYETYSLNYHTIIVITASEYHHYQSI